MTISMRHLPGMTVQQAPNLNLVARRRCAALVGACVDLAGAGPVERSTRSAGSAGDVYRFGDRLGFHEQNTAKPLKHGGAAPAQEPGGDDRGDDEGYEHPREEVRRRGR